MKTPTRGVSTNSIQYKYQYQYWHLAKNNHRSDTAEIFGGVRLSLRNEKNVSRISGLRSKESFISIICLRCPWSEKEEKLKEDICPAPSEKKMQKISRKNLTRKALKRQHIQSFLLEHVWAKIFQKVCEICQEASKPILLHERA